MRYKVVSIGPSVSSFHWLCIGNLHVLPIVSLSQVHTHMLNVDVVTLFDPVLVDELRHIEEQCESCLTSLTKRETDSIPASSSTTPAMEHD